MSGEKLAFDHRPDPVLGAALRRALEPGDQAAFVARVLAAYTSARAEKPLWEVLAGWSGAGIAAAMLTALVAGFLFGRVIRAPVGLDEVFASSTMDTASAVLVTAQRPPDASVLLAGFER